jgi:hypothetical protein
MYFPPLTPTNIGIRPGTYDKSCPHVHIIAPESPDEAKRFTNSGFAPSLIARPFPAEALGVNGDGGGLCWRLAEGVDVGVGRGFVSRMHIYASFCLWV